MAAAAMLMMAVVVVVVLTMLLCMCDVENNNRSENFNKAKHLQSGRNFFCSLFHSFRFYSTFNLSSIHSLDRLLDRYFCAPFGFHMCIKLILLLILTTGDLLWKC